MSYNIKTINLGLISYKDALEYQTKIFKKILEQKKNKEKEIENTIFFCEHNAVFTLGKNGAINNLHVNSEYLKNKGIEFFNINRGGDITFHGPGQIVVYPILNLETFKIGLKDYVHILEAAVIDILKEFNIISQRLSGATGVWIDVEKPNTRKICAIGVYSRQWVTMHGLALNVNTDLSYFNLINPCGFKDKQVTSIEKEIKKSVDFETVRIILEQKLLNLLKYETSHYNNFKKA